MTRRLSSEPPALPSFLYGCPHPPASSDIQGPTSSVTLTCDQASFTFFITAERYLPAATKNIRDAWSQVNVTWDEVAMSQNTKRVSFNMSALGEVVHVDGNRDKNMDETLEEAELQSTVLTLESILLHVFIFLRVYCVN